MTHVPNPPEKHFWRISYDAEFRSLRVQLRRKYPLAFSDPVASQTLHYSKLPPDELRAGTALPWHIDYRPGGFSTLESALYVACELLTEKLARQSEVPEEVAAILGNHYHVKG